MPTELSVHATQEEGMRFSMTARGHTVITDYLLQPDAAGAGMRSLELLLASLASCAGGSMVVLLRKLQQPAQRVEVNVRASRRDEHPTLLTDIAMEFVVHGTGLDPKTVARALTLSEEQICPVWAMLKGGTRITSSLRIEAK
ncbi:MAG TPA: OsmC family protein [Opitutaceae bacterium]|nr:OsmC family protein [Opitutaceae bacterium]